MSWSIRRAGMNVKALADEIRGEGAPEAVKERLAAQVESIALQPHQVVVVESSGHFDTGGNYGAASNEQSMVSVIGCLSAPAPIEVPVAAVAPATEVAGEAKPAG